MSATINVEDSTKYTEVAKKALKKSSEDEECRKNEGKSKNVHLTFRRFHTQLNGGYVLNCFASADNTYLTLDNSGYHERSYQPF